MNQFDRGKSADVLINGAGSTGRRNTPLIDCFCRLFKEDRSLGLDSFYT